MDIYDYLVENEISQTSFAGTIGIHVMTLHKIMKLGGTPSLETALKIEAASHGKVTCKDLLLGQKRKYRKPLKPKTLVRRKQVKIQNLTLTHAVVL
jgi:DNA-binding transcriptional regulator YdaS (Cro superfamily)